MHICRTAAELRAVRNSLRSPVALVPTMGALHAGHESLFKRSRDENATVVASIFVNPLQFGPNEDLAQYPLTPEDDSALLERVSCDVLFAPTVDEMYPAGSQTRVQPGEVATHLEGESRPGHFAGVATVVLKLFSLVTPDRAYFGEKDAQQLAVVRRMVRDFDLPVEIIACPTVRESDGLAISSRNRRLSDVQRRDAVGLSRALRLIVETLERGATDIGAVSRAASAELGALKQDYLAVVDPADFVPLDAVPRHADLLAVGAAFCGTTRLIDNMKLRSA
ncbi:MAG TPA: pantoate--beta-alanine ligase [Candidatus Eremiobacteraceae bacterium]|nr:pantoate--beta-alanine ligase [Candidatus Eremiobacteraceae bacterium]